MLRASAASPPPQLPVTQSRLACSCPAARRAVSLRSCRLSSPAQLSHGHPPHPAARRTPIQARKQDGQVFGTETGSELAGLGGSAAERDFIPTAASPAGPGPAEALPDSLGDSDSAGHINSSVPGVFSTLRTALVQILAVCLFWVRGSESPCCKDVSCLHSVALDSGFGQTCNFGMLEPKGPSPAPAACADGQDTGRDAGRAGHSPRLRSLAWRATPMAFL